MSFYSVRHGAVVGTGKAIWVNLGGYGLLGKVKAEFLSKAYSIDSASKAIDDGESFFCGWQCLRA